MYAHKINERAQIDQLMCTGTDMDFITLLEQVPALLHMCVCGHGFLQRCVGTLRLINKDASRVALLALTFFKVSLKGQPKDTNVRRASLLRGAHLTKLNVDLMLSGKHTEV